jgi:predicted glycosyltransferase
MALLMRDITFGPDQTRAIWTNESVYPLLDEVYDRILVYGDRRVFDPISAYGMSDPAAQRTRFCGYLAPVPPQRTPVEVRSAIGATDLPLVVVSVGGGGDGASILEAYLTGLAARVGPPIHSYLAMGPLLPDADRQTVANLIRGLPNLTVVDFDPDFAAAVRAADVVVCMGGYNSLVEAAYFGKRPVVVPRTPGPEEQILRAEGFAKLGLATLVDPRRVDPMTLWAAIESELARTPPTEMPLAFDGREQIARELAGLAAGRAAEPDPA